jgi:hypothetical protein
MKLKKKKQIKWWGGGQNLFSFFINDDYLLSKCLPDGQRTGTESLEKLNPHGK